MRIGILTLHDSPNYGAVLQAFALRSHLTSLGHDAFVIDRRRDKGEAPLRTPPPRAETVNLLGVVSVSAHNGAREYARRCSRTLSFLHDRVRMSPYHFSDWKDAPADLGLDLVVVGSDQVWNASNLRPADYLLQDVPGSPPGIAYAASIGMPEIPPELAEDFRRGLARFSAIGVREREAAQLVRSLGFSAEHVVDPVLLAGTEIWREATVPSEGRGGRIFAYFLAEDFENQLPALSAFAARTHRRVDFLADWFVRREPHGIGGCLRNVRFERKWRKRGMDFRLDYGPAEFVRALSDADVVISNSYHALMFSLLFDKEVRIVLPTHPVRRKMNARLRELGEELVDGPLISNDLAEALSSLESGARVTVRREALDRKVAHSRQWLERVLGAIRT